MHEYISIYLNTTVNYSSFATLSSVITVTVFAFSRETAWEVVLGLKMSASFHYFEDAKSGWLR